MSGYEVPRFHQLTPVEEIERRLEAAREKLLQAGLDAALIVYTPDLFYLTGTGQNAHLVLTASGPPLLLVRRDLERAKAETPIKEVSELGSLKLLPLQIQERLGRPPRRIGLELDILPVSWFKRYEKLWPQVEFLDFSPALMELRAVKSLYEAKKMRLAGLTAREVYDLIPGLMKPGQSEIELAGLITSEAYARGHQNYLPMRSFNQVMFTWHVISGASGSALGGIDASFAGFGLSPAFPMGASHKKIRVGEPVLIDFGMCLDGYMVDLTRMFSLGKPPDRILEAYQALKTIEAGLLDGLRPGNACEDLFHLAVSQADELGFGDSFLGLPNHKIRFAGHGVGLEISEPPYLSPGFGTPLQAGMTLALELKMVFPELGAVGLENTLLITEDQPVKLSPANEEFLIID